MRHVVDLSLLAADARPSNDERPWKETGLRSSFGTEEADEGFVESLLGAVRLGRVLFLWLLSQTNPTVEYENA